MDRSTHVGGLIKVLKLKFASATTQEAQQISRLLVKIVQKAPNLKTISARMSSGREGQDLVIPSLDRELLDGCASNVVNLNFIFESYTMPFTMFAQGFQNLKVLQIGHVDMSRLTVTKQDLGMRLPNVEWLQLTSPKLSPEAVNLLACVLPRVKSVEAVAVSGGIVDLLCAIADRTDSLCDVKLSRCTDQKLKNMLTYKLWTTLQSIEITGCCMLSSSILPTYRLSKIKALPKLKRLKIIADIKLPISNEQFEELLEAVNLLPSVVGQVDELERYSDSQPATGSRALDTAAAGVDIAIICDNCAFGDTFGSASLLASAQRYVTLPNYMRYTILETVGPIDEPRAVKHMDTQTIERFRMDLGIPWRQSSTAIISYA